MSKVRHIIPCWSLFVAILAGCGTSQTPAPLEFPQDLDMASCIVGVSSDTFEIMTWNVKDFPLDGDFTISQIQQLIAQQNPDVLAFQEITSVVFFDKLTNGLEAWESQLFISGNLNLGYLYKTSEIEIVENISPILEGNPYAFPRAPVRIDIKHKSGIEVHLINIHLKCCGGADNIARRDSASRMIKRYIEFNLESEPVVLLGDYNDIIYEPTPEAHPFLNFTADNANYRFTDMEIAMGNKQFWSYPGWPSHIDHILITNELFDFWAGTTTVTYDICDDRYLQYISDHRPLMIKLVK